MNLVAIDLAPALQLRGREDDDEEDGDGHDIWPAPKKPCLLPSPWQSLPLDLLFHSVLVRLPFSALLNLRRVSRSWRHSLSSYDFWVLWFQGNQPYPSQIQNVSLNPNLMQNRSPHRIPNTIRNPNSIQNRNRNAMQNVVSNHGNPSPNSIQHNPSSYSVRNCPVPCLLLCSAQFKASHGCQVARWLRQHSIRYVQQQYAAPTHRIPHYWLRLHESFMQVQEPYIILASDGGLLLLATCGEGSQQLIVCNPLLRAHKVVHDSFFPPFTDISAMATPTAMAFIADKEHGEYRVLLSSAGFQVYISSTDNWQRIPTVSFKDSATASPPILDGSNFWLSHQQMSLNGNDEATLVVYHADVEVITCVSTHFPQGVSFPNCGRVWKDPSGLQTLAWSSTWFGTWKLDNGLWKCEKRLPFKQHMFNLSELDYVKVDNLLLVRFPKFNEVYVFDFGLGIGSFTACCADSEYLTGHCVFQPSCIQV